jgi:hypothetical protein
MLIEKKYYDIAKMEEDNAWREINIKDANMTDEEKKIDRKTRAEEADCLMQKAENMRHKNNRVPSDDKSKAFDRLMKDSLELAKLMEMNVKIKISDDKSYGLIEFVFREMWILGEYVEEWSRICKSATSLYIDIRGTMVVYECYYDLCKEIPGV